MHQPAMKKRETCEESLSKWPIPQCGLGISFSAKHLSMWVYAWEAASTRGGAQHDWLEYYEMCTHVHNTLCTIHRSHVQVNMVFPSPTITVECSVPLRQRLGQRLWEPDYSRQRWRQLAVA